MVSNIKTVPAPLVVLDHGELWTTSTLVAAKFGKRHDNVVQAIERMECSDEFNLLNFKEITYLDDRGREQRAYRISRDGFSFLAMGFTGRPAARWKEEFISAFNKMEREQRRIVTNRALPEWHEARQFGKIERKGLTGAVQLLCERAHSRGESTTPLARWEIAATKVVTTALFETNGQRITSIRDSLTPRQLRRMATVEMIYAETILSCIDSDLHHRVINERAKACIQAFVAATGGREVPGEDPRPVGSLRASL